MNRNHLLELVPHYIASLLLILATITAIRVFVDNFGIVVELPIVVAVVLAYPTIVRWLGISPAAWEDHPDDKGP